MGNEEGAIRFWQDREGRSFLGRSRFWGMAIAFWDRGEAIPPSVSWKVVIDQAIADVTDCPSRVKIEALY
ncbi:MAG UNVERIFIED_CONTAM: hypothetical protein LVR29_30455 [Microcystis novacekii LVE1205-3]